MKLIILVGVIIILIVVLFKVYQKVNIERSRKEQLKKQQEQEKTSQERSKFYNQLLRLALIKKKQGELEEENKTTAGDWIKTITSVGDAVIAVWLGVDPSSSTLAEEVFQD